MTTRTRTRGEQWTLYKPGVVTEYSAYDDVPTGLTWGLNDPELALGVVEQITDTADSPGGEHNVYHTKLELGSTGQYMDMRTLTYSIGWDFSHWRDNLVYRNVHTYVSPRILLSPYTGHATDPGISGIRALAIARVPAYDQSQLEGMIALREAVGMVDTTAFKAASALGRFAANAWRSHRAGGRHATRISRDAKRALADLASGRAEPKTAFGRFLGGVTFASGLDMEWKYGWAPMLKDIQGANDTVAKLGSLRARLLEGNRVYGRANSYVSKDHSDVEPKYATFDLNPRVIKIRKFTKTFAVASIVRALRPSCSYIDVDWFTMLDIVQEVNGLTPSLKKEWQLMPLSFIIDWFWNVSNLLESMQTLKSPIGADFTSYGGLYSIKQQTTCKGSCTFLGAAGSPTIDLSGVYTTYSRSVDPLEEGPALYIPPLQLPTKASQWWSMAQIAFQIRMGRNAPRR